MRSIYSMSQSPIEGTLTISVLVKHRQPWSLFSPLLSSMQLEKVYPAAERAVQNRRSLKTF